MLMNTGAAPVSSRNRLLTTIGWQGPPGDQRTAYCLEGSVFMAGATVQWLRDGLQVIQSAPEVESLAAQVDDTGDVYLVPAFAGLGTPDWDGYARGTLVGMTRGTTRAHLARAALEAIALQNVDLLRSMQADAGIGITNLRVDGGAAANDLLMQIQADLLGLQIFRPEMVELTALGAAKLAARGAGLPRTDRSGETARVRIFNPSMAPAAREEMLARWHTMVARA
jgi:glycerol kinase